MADTMFIREFSCHEALHGLHAITFVALVWNISNTGQVISIRRCPHIQYVIWRIEYAGKGMVVHWKKQAGGSDRRSAGLLLRLIGAAGISLH